METVTYGGKTTTYSYDDNGRRSSVTYEGGVSENYSYDRDNRLITLTNTKPNGGKISEYSYTYDLAGRQITKTDLYGTTDYEYDKAGRITKVATPGKTTVYSYDKAGNRVSQNETYISLQPSDYVDETTGKEIQYILKKSDYTYSNSNQLLKLVERMFDGDNKEIARKTTKYSYDSNGNQLKQSISHTLPDNTGLRPKTTGTAYGDNVSNTIDKLVEKISYTYDGFNRLKKTETVKAGIRTTVHFTYNGDDLRVSKTVKKSDKGYTAEVTNYLYDRQNVILETDGSTNVKARYIKGINYIAKADAAGKESYFLFNGHGDVVQTVDAAGTVQNQYDYDIWGNPTLTVETANNAIRYTGEFYDEETGLYYLRARYYDPNLGRFTTEDSYWGEDNNPLSLNLYTYCQNDPIQYVDPTGHLSEWDKQNLPKDQQKKVEQYGKDYAAAQKSGNKAEMAKAHERAEEIRNQYRNDNEYGTKDGNTVTKPSGSDKGGKGSGAGSGSGTGSSSGGSNKPPEKPKQSPKPKDAEGYSSESINGNNVLNSNSVTTGQNTLSVNKPVQKNSPQSPTVANAKVGEKIVGNAQVVDGVVTGNLKDIVEGLGGKVTYNSVTKSVKVTDKNGKVVAAYKIENGRAIEYKIVNGVIQYDILNVKSISSDGRIQVSVSDLAKKFNVEDTVSWWKDDKNIMNVVVQPDMKGAAVQVTRSGDTINIKAYVEFTGAYQDIFPGTNITYADVAAAGILSKWNGTFTGNQYDFTPGKNITVNTKIYSNQKSSANLWTSAGSNQKDFLEIYIDNTDPVYYGPAGINPIQHTQNVPHMDGGQDDWSVSNDKKITMYRSHSGDPNEYSQYGYASTIAHEFGHVLGLGDAYGDKDKGRVAATNTPEVPVTQWLQDDIMVHNGYVTPNDVEMVWQAWSTNEWQYFTDYKGHKKSEVIKSY